MKLNTPIYTKHNDQNTIFSISFVSLHSASLSYASIKPFGLKSQVGITVELSIEVAFIVAKRSTSASQSAIIFNWVVFRGSSFHSSTFDSISTLYTHAYLPKVAYSYSKLLFYIVICRGIKLLALKTKD